MYFASSAVFDPAMTFRQRKEASGESSKQDGSSAAGIFVMIAIHDIENTGSS
jgi:hypothetical protein